MGKCPTPCKKGGIVREGKCPGEYVQEKCSDPAFDCLEVNGVTVQSYHANSFLLD